MRRGEALTLRWRDVDLDAGRLAVRRSVGVVKTKGAGERLVEGPTKTGRSRVVDLDAGTVAALRGYRAARGGLALNEIGAGTCMRQFLRLCQALRRCHGLRCDNSFVRRTCNCQSL